MLLVSFSGFRIFEHYSNTTEIEPEKLTNNTMDEELLRKAIAVIERNMDNVEFSTEQFAREMNMSRSNLHLKLKAITGKSAIDFIHKIRFNRACQLLQEGKYNVSEISFMVGYNTPSYFAARFKKYIGCLPTGDQNDIAQAGAQHCRDKQGQQREGEAELDVHQAHDDRVHPFAVVAGQAAQDHAHDAAYHGAGQSYNQGDAGAVQQTGENVAAQLVSAQQMAGHRVSAPDGVLQLDHDVLSQRVTPFACKYSAAPTLNSQLSTLNSRSFPSNPFQLRLCPPGKHSFQRYHSRQPANG